MSRDQVEGIFSREGVLSRVLSPNFEWRPQQGEMARAVWDSLEYGGSVLVEAPTGVGKSLSYLIPAVLYAQRESKPCVISTHTKNLQDQILEKEIPRIQRIVDRNIRAVVLKGRGNYLCRTRWESFVEEAGGTNDGERIVRLLTNWVDFTETGDLSEAPELSPRDRHVLARISSDDRFCASNRCTPETGCFYKTSRKEAKEAHLIVINHALLVTDLFGAGGGLPDYDSLILDEGHHLPDAAAGPLSYAVSEKSLEGALKSLGGRGEPGVTDDLRKILRSVTSPEQRRVVLERLRDLEAETGRLLKSARGFWQELQAAPVYPKQWERFRYGPSSPNLESFPSSGPELCQQLAAHLRKIAVEIDDVANIDRHERGDVREPAPVREARRRQDRAMEMLGYLEELLTPSERERVYWIDPTGPGGSTLRTSPLHVGRYLRDSLFQKKRAVVLTSATLSVLGSFDLVADKLGVPESQRETLALPSPFRLEDQVQAWIHTQAPDPNDPSFVDVIAAGVEQLAVKLQKKTLVLFTSHDALRKVAERLEDPLAARGIPLLAQGVHGGRRQIRNRFVQGESAVLLGAASFWEGVDFPGQELEVLVLTRLPFLVPNDPLVEARVERLKAEGKDPFSSFYLPEAILRFRQGFGRLIRRQEDRGLFVVVDPRIGQRNYGKQFRESVGVPFRQATAWDEITAAGEDWFTVDPF
ncbi:MAG: DEAD/DEAH box helicase [Candidatus Eisenbacteria bacterium]|uniref:DNA 5'-3' helicase n=1 Tax=Eiseniibacteriota bacterium TaxID=2212470 RepID=A0A956SDZ8_UNCEI|nr:DEAD/DEAH box helicase [Candidatus Eisenbacteria bacterium]MCB9462893.1 DEAD/DEAH box helicase [Candidatus Eisenbacteria bacterium]